MDIDKIIAEVERLDREATRGWSARNDNGVWGDSPYVVNQHLLVFSLNPAYARDTARSNVEMAALGRAAAPILAAEVKRLRAGGCARDQRTTQFCAEAVAKDAEIAKLRDQILDYQQSLHIAEQEIARLKRALVEFTEQTGDEDSEQ